MTDAEYTTQMTHLQLLAQVLADSHGSIAACLEHVSEWHVLGPIVDPALYRESFQTLEEEAALLRPLLTAAADLMPLLETWRQRVRERVA